jgi:deoxyribonuclease-4
MPYLCNPASTNKAVHDKSRTMLIDNIRNCKALGIRYLVMHTGSHLGGGTGIGIENVCNLLGSVMGAVEGVDVLLENGSGYNNSVGSKFEEIGEIIDRLGMDRLGVCFDTCHAFAAGYDISTDASVDKMVEEFESSIGLSRLRFVHLNDAKHPLGSGLDRHWHIGKGYIGRKGFLSLFRNKAFRDGSFVMELPEDSEAGHLQDMDAARSMIEEVGTK